MKMIAVRCLTCNGTRTVWRFPHVELSTAYLKGDEPLTPGPLPVRMWCPDCNGTGKVLIPEGTESHLDVLSDA